MIFLLTQKIFAEFFDKKLYNDPSTFLEIYELLESIHLRNSESYYDEAVYKLNNATIIFDNSIEAKQIQKLLFNSRVKAAKDGKYDSEIGFRGTSYNVIKSEDELIEFLKNMLLKTTCTHEFFLLISNFYYELVFLDNVRQSMSVFNFKHKKTKEAIISHLDAILEKFKSCFDSYRGENLTVVMNHFKGETKIDCSCENDRKLVSKYRTIKFINSKKNDEIHNVSFELHTKLNLTTLNERIHFSKGESNIFGGKIIIGHIGKHLYDPQNGFKHGYSKLPEEVKLPFTSPDVTTL